MKVTMVGRLRPIPIWVLIYLLRWLGTNWYNSWSYPGKFDFYSEERNWYFREDINCRSDSNYFQLNCNNNHFFRRIYSDNRIINWTQNHWIWLSWYCFGTMGKIKLVFNGRGFNFTFLYSGIFIPHVLLCCSSFSIPTYDEFKKTYQKSYQYYL